MTQEASIEQELVAKGLTAPRITPIDVTMNIVGESYHVFPGSLTTICELTLKNGFRVVGMSACASPLNFDADVGKRIAYEDARRQVWGYMGYELKSKLALVAGVTSLKKDDALHILGEPKTYVGTKVVYAMPMNRLEYNQLRGWELPANENGDDECYLIQYADGGKSNMPGFSGYLSWSPRDVFEKAYQRV